MYMSKVIDAATISRDPEETSGMLAEVLAHVHDLKDYYPDFESWLTNLVVPGIAQGDRSVIVEYRQGRLAGLAILKDDGYEKKLCCLRVLPEFQQVAGLGVRLFEKSFDVLQTERPLLSVAEERVLLFGRIFEYFGFEQGDKYAGLYRHGKAEFSFNGSLLLPQEAASVIKIRAAAGARR